MKNSEKKLNEFRVLGPPKIFVNSENIFHPKSANILRNWGLFRFIFPLFFHSNASALTEFGAKLEFKQTELKDDPVSH